MNTDPHPRIKGQCPMGCGECRTIMLDDTAPLRCEQHWWQEHIEPYRGSVERCRERAFWCWLNVHFLPGRMRFDRSGVVVGPKRDRPPFGCCLVVWR